MNNPYTGPAVTGKWRFQLLTPDLSTEVPWPENVGVTGGNLDWALGRAVKDGGKLTVQYPPGVPGLDWTQLRIRISWDMTYPQQIQHTLGTYIPASAETTYHNGTRIQPVSLHGMTSLLAQQRLLQTFSVEKGANIEATLKGLLVDMPLGVQPLTGVMPAGKVWDAGTTLLEVVNDLLDGGGYFAAHSTPEGVLGCRPYDTPAQRPIKHTFNTDGYSRGWKLKNDSWAVPNRLVAKQRTDHTETPGAAVVVDTTSPYAKDRIGYFVDAEPIEVQASNMAELRAAAIRRLRSIQGKTTTLDIDYGYIPITMHDVVRFINKPANIDELFSLVSYKINLSDSTPLVSGHFWKVAQ